MERETVTRMKRRMGIDTPNELPCLRCPVVGPCSTRAVSRYKIARKWTPPEYRQNVAYWHYFFAAKVARIEGKPLALDDESEDLPPEQRDDDPEDEVRPDAVAVAPGPGHPEAEEQPHDHDQPEQ